jgi:hypothetical protein
MQDLFNAIEQYAIAKKLYDKECLKGIKYGVADITKYTSIELADFNRAKEKVQEELDKYISLKIQEYLAEG